MLSSLLRAHHISRLAIAHELGSSTQTIHNWCSGRILIPPHKLEPLCQSLHQHGVPDHALSQLTAHSLQSHGIPPNRLDLKPNAPRPAVMILSWNLMSPGTFGPITQTARASLEGLGYECLVVDCGGEHRLRRTYLQKAPSLGLAGILLSGIPGEPPDPDDDLLSSIAPISAAGIPAVFLKPWTGSVSLPPGVGSIGWDSIAAVQQAIGLLVQHGHTRIRAILAESGANFGGRYRGLDSVWRNLNLPFNEDSCIAWLPREQRSSELKDSLSQASAVFTPPSNLPALAKACFESSINWPRDISISSLGNREFIPQLSQRPFTFVNIPVGRVSRGGAQLLSSMIKGERFQTGQEYVIYGASAMSIENLNSGSVGPPPKRPLSTTPTPFAATPPTEPQPTTTP